MKVAIVYDRVNKFGGAEQVLLALHELWPNAPLFTAVYHPPTAGWAKNFEVIPSFLNAFPFAKRHHEIYPWLTPMAFESFSFDDYDVVISVTSAEAKSIITKPSTIHICYCLTPTRYLWSGYETYQNFPGLGIGSAFGASFLKKSIPVLRKWDQVSSSRPDYYLAISQLVKKRVETYYHRDVAQIIYPPVNTDKFIVGSRARPSSFPQGYYLTVARLVGYKRLDILIRAFNQLQLPLVIIGDGHEKARLLQMAEKTIRIITTKLTEEKITEYYQHCTAFVYAAEEDFGIAAAEAQACGKPVVAYKKSGIADIVDDQKTGILFPEQTVESLVQAILKFQTINFDPFECRARALQFSRRLFQEKISAFVNLVYKQ